MIEGLITKGIGGFYYIAAEDRLITCRARGKFRKNGITPVVGDHVIITVNEDGSGYLNEILPRKNYSIRPPVANIDRLFIVTCQNSPAPSYLFIDKLTVIASHKKIEVIIVVNKSDIDRGEELKDIYTSCGFTVINTSAVTGEGIDKIKDLLYGKVSAFTGNSGVGKSSILNLISPKIAMETGDISKKISRGKHTTRHVELFDLGDGTMVADTPGFGSYEIEQTAQILKDELQYEFIEFEPYLNKCKFTGCSHISEIGCVVLQAAKEGKIPKSRIASYKEMYEELKKIKEWEL